MYIYSCELHLKVVQSEGKLLCNQLEAEKSLLHLSARRKWPLTILESFQNFELLISSACYFTLNVPISTNKHFLVNLIPEKLKHILIPLNINS